MILYKEICKEDLSLRDYQQEAKDKIFNEWDNVNNVLYQMPTGTGKTRLFTSIIRDISLSRKLRGLRGRVLIIAHRTELIEQISASLEKYGVRHGIIAGTFKDKRDFALQVQVASIQTITNHSNIHIAEVFGPDFIIVDEAHHCLANSYKKLWRLFPDAKKLGVTATPWRMDGMGFTEVFDVLVSSMSIKEFLDRGWLAPYKYYSVPIESEIVSAIDSISDFGIDGDYKVSEVEKVMSAQRIRAQLFDSYNAHVRGKKGIIYSISRYHSALICEQYSAEGVNIAAIDGTTPANVRSRVVREFKEGKIEIIVNVDIFSEGFDCPDIEFIQLARPTMSLVKYLQQIGRGLRKNGDKQCVILDNVGLYSRFGLPDDDRDWNSHFLGTLKESTSRSERACTSEVRDIVVKLDKLQEGNDDMFLIQSLESPKNEEVSMRTLVEETEEIAPIESEVGDERETRSQAVFAKYAIVECYDGIYIENIRANVRQRLCDLNGPRIVSIKIAKTPGYTKRFTLLGSYNKSKDISVLDHIIGYLYKEGSLLRFSHVKNQDLVPVKI